MSYCYTEMDNPAIFAGAGDCETIGHDLAAIDGGLRDAINPAVSAILIQLNTDKVFAGERGFWGDEFIGFEIGSHLWRVSGAQRVEGLPVIIDEYVRDALNPVIRQGLIDSISVRVVQQVEGLQVTVDALKGGVSIFRTVNNG